jgi:hypothetical protein
MVDLSGDWHSYYRYPSSGRGGDIFWGQNLLHATHDGDTLKFETGSESAARILIDLKLNKDGTVAKGTWYERTDPDGYYKGAEYDGTIELHVVGGGERLNGIWHGKGSNGEMHSDIWELAKAKNSAQDEALPKRWKLTHWYPNSDNELDAESDSHEMKGYLDGDTLVLESTPQENGSYMLARLHIQGDIVTGNWHESAALTGKYRGAQYSGAGQLTLDEDTHHMEGKWAGAGYDIKQKKMRIYTGKWEIVPMSENE